MRWLSIGLVLGALAIGPAAVAQFTPTMGTPGSGSVVGGNRQALPPPLTFLATWGASPGVLSLPQTAATGQTINFAARGTSRYCQTSPGVYATATSTQQCVEVGGLLIEPDTFNQAAYSSDLTHWTSISTETGPTITADAAAGPDGTTTADRVDFAAVNVVNHYSVLRIGVLGLASGSTGTWSVWLKGVSGSGSQWIYIYNSSLSTYAAAQLCSYTSTAWSRCSLSVTSAGAYNFAWVLGTDFSSGSPMAATAAQSVYAWGGDVEVSGHATTTIISGATPPSERGPDQITTSRHGNVDFNSAWCVGGTIDMTGRTYAGGTGTLNGDGKTAILAASQAGTGIQYPSANSVYLYVDTSRVFKVDIYDSSGTLSRAAYTLPDDLGHTFLACRSGSTITQYVDGAAVTSTYSGAGTLAVANPSTIYLGALGNAPSGSQTSWLGAHLSSVIMCNSSSPSSCTVSSPRATAQSKKRTATVGDSQSHNGSPTYSQTAMTALGAGWTNDNFSVVGQTTGQFLTTQWTPSVDGYGYGWIIVLGGDNDLLGGGTAATAYANVKTIYDAAPAQDAKVVVMTMPPAGNNASWDSTKQTQIAAFNQDLRDYVTAHPTYAVLVDVYALVGDTDPTKIAPAYDSGDGEHLNQAGLNLVGAHVATAIQSLP